MGTYLTGTYSVIHNGNTADFDNFVYSAIYINDASSGPYTINGTSVKAYDSKTIELIIDEATTVLSGNDFLLLGNPIAPQTKVKTGLISGTTETFQGNNKGRVETYQYVDIKTGNPIRS